MAITTNMQLEDTLFQSLVIKEDSTLRIQAGERISTNAFISYTKEDAHINCTIEIAKDANVNLLFWNKTLGSSEFTYHIILEENAQAHIGFGDLQDASSKYHITSNLEAPGSYLHISSACLAMKKHFVMDITHVAPHTSALMENFAIVREEGDYEMKATGRILKGAYGASSHQASRVLTISQKQKSEVVPVLLIDENDVKASHATTLGQPDENQLYYLCSRGLSRNEAIGLLTMGYLMPISEVVQNEQLKQQLLQEIEEKVIRND